MIAKKSGYRLVGEAALQEYKISYLSNLSKGQINTLRSGFFGFWNLM